VFTATTFADDGTANSLRGAISASNADTGTATDTIQLQAGTYTLTIANSSGLHEIKNASGDLNITNTNHALVIEGATDAKGKPTTIIQQTVADRVFEFLGEDSLNTVTFENLVIEGGQAQDDGRPGAAAGTTIAEGGGILDGSGVVTLTNVVLQNNSAHAGAGLIAEGGGIAQVGIGSLTIQSSVIQSNKVLLDPSGTSTTNANGGIAIGGGVSADNSSSTLTDPTLIITNSTVSDNTATGGNADTGEGGEADGGGIYAFASTTINDSTLSGNTVIGGNSNDKGGGNALGGGLYSQLITTLTASTLSGNTVTGGNGGGSAAPGVAQGGGGYFGEVGGALVNSTIADNQTVGGQGTTSNPVASGGGLFFNNGTLTNVTVADNQASPPQGGTGTTSGGGIAIGGGTVTLVNTLVALNSATTSPDVAGTAGTGSGHNLIGEADGGTGFSTANGDKFGSTASPLNPLLGSLQNNGGPTQTIALLAGSPALNAGDNSALAATGSSDQRGQGFARVVNGTIDIGAFEVQPPPPPSSPPPPPSSPPPSPTPKPPPVLHTPSLLALFDELLHGVETINGNDTETVIDSLFGISLLVSTYDGAGNLTSVTLFGTNITALFEMS
jgi:hypothetical protein